MRTSHAETILAKLHDQCVRGLDCDVILRAVDHLNLNESPDTTTGSSEDNAWISLHCHKNVIRAASSFIDGIFSKRMTEESLQVEEGIDAKVVENNGKRDIVQLTFHKISSHSVQAIVEFAYTGSVNLDTTVLKKVLEDLNFMNMQSMLEELSSRTNDDLSPSNAIFKLVMSFSLQLDEHYRKVLSFILHEFCHGLKRDKSFVETLTSVIDEQLPCRETSYKVLSALEKEAEIIGNLGLTEDHCVILTLMKLIRTNCISKDDELKLLNFLITKRREKCHIHFEKIILYCLTDDEQLCVKCLRKGHAKHHVEPVDEVKCDQLAPFWNRTDMDLDNIKQSSKERLIALKEFENIIMEERIHNLAIQDSCCQIKPKMDNLANIFKSGTIAPNDYDALAFQQFIAVMQKESKCLKDEYQKAKRLSDELLGLMEKRIATCAYIIDDALDIATLEEFEEIDLDQPLNLSNCSSILQRAKKKDNKQVYGRAFDFIVENFMSVVDECGTSFHRRIGPGVLEDLLKSDRLNVESEDDVILVVKEWLDFDIRQRKKYASKLLKQIRFGEVSKEMLGKFDDDPSFLVLLDEEAKHFLSDAVSGRRTRNPRDSIVTKLLALGESGKNLLYKSVKCSWEEWNSQDNIYGFGAVKVSKNIYIIGGENDDTRLSKVSIYNVETKTWKNGPSLREARSRFGVCVDSKNTIYVLGGLSDNTYVGRNSAELLHCDRNGEPTGDWQALPSMTKKRCFFEAAVIDDKVYAVGGYSKGMLKDMEVFDNKLNVWKECRPMSQNRHGHAVATFDEEIYVFGKDGVCEKYNPVTDTWTAIASCPNKTSFRGSAVFDGEIYLVGGLNKTETDIYDAKTNKWSTGPQLPRDIGTTKCVTWK